MFDELPDALLNEVPGDVFGDCSSTGGTAPSHAEPYNLPLMPPQYPTEGVLRERLAGLGHAPRFGHELTGCEHDGEGVTARLAQADGATATVRVRCLAGAGGGRSFVRKTLAIDFPGESMKMRAMVADRSLSGLGLTPAIVGARVPGKSVCVR